MCCHSRVIYGTCGHSTFCRRPLIECQNASFEPLVPWSTGCEIVAHPYKSLRLDQLCPQCQRRRDELLRDIEEKQVVRFDEWQWKVSYGLSGGKDYWSQKAEERAEAEKKQNEPPKTPKRKKSSVKRFSWRKSKRKSVKTNRGDETPTTTIRE